MSFCEGSSLLDWSTRHAPDASAKDGLCGACRLQMQTAEAARPMRERRWNLYALRREEGFAHFYPSTIQLTMCGTAPHWLVQLAVDADGDLWGWYHTHHPHNRESRGHVSMIYSHRKSVEICFPYGPDAETERGRGEIVRLRVTPVRPAVHPEGIRYEDD